ncbi:hypothetical protein PMI42_07447 [Bradyrhizobium sp. YR681]|uniref:AAA family ATPase n=1 Tax=Bradyrhizobium sp. YR681 TaxID=1144344 RepID=UPI00026F8F35|nr:AAA family ATPase [Bradyrhizobium sp. YR681]EJN07917.1 hypothetical protein PMI42_07447 [Bradyrhizobium sp. YR681]
MQDRTNHNSFADQLAERLRSETAIVTPAPKVDAAYVAAGEARIVDFEMRASGDKPRRKPRTRVTTTETTPTAAAAAEAAPSPRSTNTMSNLRLLRPAEVTSAFLKAGFMGFQGAGKTKTAALTAIGLIQHLRKLNSPYADKPAAFLDSETGSDWVLPDFKEAGIELAVMKSRSFADLTAVIDEAAKECSVLVVDSATHFWKELCDSYQQKRAKELKRSTYRLQFQDWAYLKGEWAKFTDRFVNAPLHMLICGRAGFEYDYFEEEDGSKTLAKTGVKMKAEGEFGFEPSLLVQMEVVQKVEGKAVANVWREAHVVKDRANLIDGKTFKFCSTFDNGERLPLKTLIDQTWVAFAPHIQRLNLGGRHVGVDTSRTSEHTIATDRKDWTPVQREIVIDEIQTLLQLTYPSQSADDKKNKLRALLDHFDATWTEIEKVMPLPDLRIGYDKLHLALTGNPSKYHTAIKADAMPAILDDSLPEFAAAAG